MKGVEKTNELDNIKLEEELTDRIGDKVEELSEELVSEVLTKVKDKLGRTSIGAKTLHLVIRYTMEAVEKTPTKGKQQLDFALKVITSIVEELPDSDEKVFLVTSLANGGIENTIELVVDASRGKLEINEVVEVVATSCIPACLMYCSGKSTKQGPKKN
jgi:hypothetical protein